MPEASDRIALPIRVHEFLLACAGRVDDDVLTDAREFLAVAELDRAVELLAASLVAGRIPLTAEERDDLRDLLDAARSNQALADRIVIDDLNLPNRHRFTVGTEDDPAPDAGVSEALNRVMEVLPDIRALTCVWRVSPAGMPAGPVPQRLVLVETGPDGFATSTAYRVEQALRRAGIRAAVEVLVAGSDLGMYHREALDAGRRLPMRRRSTASTPASSVSTSSSVAEPMYEQPAPRSVTSTRRRAAHAEKHSGESASGRWQQRVSGAESAAPAPPVDNAPTGSMPSSGPRSAPSAPVPPPPGPMPTASGPNGGGMTGPMPPSGPLASSGSMTPVPEPDRNASANSAGKAEERSAPRPSQIPPMPELPTPPAMTGEPPAGRSRDSRTGLTPVPPPPPNPAPQSSAGTNGSKGSDRASSGRSRPEPAETGGKDSDLSLREQELLRQLHEELAKREEQMPEPSGEPFGWTVDRSGHSAGSGPNGGSSSPSMEYGASWQNTTEQTQVNGIPPYGMSQS
ncbi:MAG TPA: hypothetical protein VG756_07150 [Pseudonocardiaceae bacterium]|nr:hypothetical protein [Pseudonocardiaceae bacterium]